MTSKQDFTPEEWEKVLAGPPSAGMIVITAERGGMFKETISMAKAYAEAREHHGQSELLDDIVAAKPKLDHTRFSSPEEMRDHALANLHEARELLASKATPDELEEYKGFIGHLARKVAGAHTEGGEAKGTPSDNEQAAIEQIEQTLAA
jgi:hypothetical protein